MLCLSRRYGERNPAFSVAQFEGQGEKQELSLCISSAVEKATSDYQSGASSDEESVCSSQEPKSIPTVRNPNSVYQVLLCTVLLSPTWPVHPFILLTELLCAEPTSLLNASLELLQCVCL